MFKKKYEQVNRLTIFFWKDDSSLKSWGIKCQWLILAAFTLINFTLYLKKNDKNMYLIPTDIFSFIFKNDWNLHIQI